VVAVPVSSAYSQFLTKFISHEEKINNMFNNLVKKNNQTASKFYNIKIKLKTEIFPPVLVKLRLLPRPK
jgi:hypothetical protein